MNYYTLDIVTSYGDMKVYFYPRTAVGSFTTEVTLPEDFLLKEISLVSSADDFGFANSNKLNIKVDLNSVSTALADLIIDGGANYTYEGKTYTLGWLWEVRQGSNVLFKGTQNGVESVDDLGIYEIELEGIEKAINSVFLDSLTYTMDDTGNNTNPILIAYTNAGDDIRITYNDFAGVEYNFIKLETLFTKFVSVSEDIYQEITRTLGTVAWNFDWDWVFKKQDLTTSGGATGTLDFTDLYIMGQRTDDPAFTVVAGALSEKSADNLFEYGTINGFLRTFCKSFILNAKWTYGANLTLDFKQIFKETTALNDLDYIKGSFKLTKREYQIDSSLAGIRGATSDDISQIEVTSDFDGNSIDTALIFNNNALRISECFEDPNELFNFGTLAWSGVGSEKQKREDVRTFYYKEGVDKFRMRRVHGDCSLTIAGTSYTAGSYPNYPAKATGFDFGINVETTQKILETEKERALSYGIAYIWTNALFNIFHGVCSKLEFEVAKELNSSQTLGYNDLFKGFTIDFSGFSAYGLNGIGTKFFINRLEIDFYGNWKVEGMLI